eukprot:COSAG02_NODE_8026_length_2742_cov_6.403330_3_plen_212_part_00
MPTDCCFRTCANQPTISTDMLAAVASRRAAHRERERERERESHHTHRATTHTHTHTHTDTSESSQISLPAAHRATQLRRNIGILTEKLESARIFFAQIQLLAETHPARYRTARTDKNSSFPLFDLGQVLHTNRSSLRRRGCYIIITFPHPRVHGRDNMISWEKRKPAEKSRSCTPPGYSTVSAVVRMRGPAPARALYFSRLFGAQRVSTAR